MSNPLGRSAGSPAGPPPRTNGTPSGFKNVRVLTPDPLHFRLVAYAGLSMLSLNEFVLKWLNLATPIDPATGMPAPAGSPQTAPGPPQAPISPGGRCAPAGQGAAQAAKGPSPGPSPRTTRRATPASPPPPPPRPPQPRQATCPRPEGSPMPDNFNPPTPQDPNQPVVVSPHDFDWGAGSDLVDATERHLLALGDSILHGAWFVTPATTVHAPTASAVFFRDAREARGRWLRQSRQSLSNGGQRREARSVAALARRAALADIHAADPVVPPDSPVPSPSNLAPERRLNVRQAGQIARQFAFSGVMIIDGAHIPPRTWNRMADELLGPEPPSRPCAHLRPATRSTPGSPPSAPDL